MHINSLSYAKHYARILWVYRVKVAQRDYLLSLQVAYRQNICWWNGSRCISLDFMLVPVHRWEYENSSEQFFYYILNLVVKLF